MKSHNSNNTIKIKDLQYQDVKTFMFDIIRKSLIDFGQTTKEEEILVMNESLCKFLINSYNELYLSEIQYIFDNLLKNEFIKKLTTKAIISEIDKYYPTCYFKATAQNFENQRKQNEKNSIFYKASPENQINAQAMQWKLAIPKEYRKIVVQNLFLRDIVANQWYKRDWKDVLTELNLI